MNDMVDSLNRTFSGLKLDATCVNARQHRHFGFYDVQLGHKCRVNKLMGMSNEIALNLKSKTSPIVKMIPELGIVRLQVVNGNPTTLNFDELYARSNKPSKGILPFLFGETDEGNILWNDLSCNPHMLVAGSTGSGKSVLLHSLIANASRTKNVRLYLSDPKGVEFSVYKDPRLNSFVWDVCRSYEDTINMLEDLVEEMESRYDMLLRMGMTSIEEDPSVFDKIIVIIDEAADLMLMDGRQKLFENTVCRLAQKCRAAGIYLVLATQRPSVNILTGLIKANFEARLACRVSSRVDSQVILDRPGAELLVGRGDAILKSRLHDYVRFQVAYTTPTDIVKNFLARKSL